MENDKCCISIHAPTNGATIPDQGARSVVAISIHAPTNGATKNMHTDFINIYNFNPRSDERSDDSSWTDKKEYPAISIHAPTNGATFVKLSILFDELFQSTLRRTERPPAQQI